MKIRLAPYFRLWRPLPVIWATASLVNPVVSFCFLTRTPFATQRFIGGHLLLPFSLGAVLALIVARIIHQPNFLLLPGARRYFFRAQCVAFVVFAAVAALIATATDGSLPWAGTLGLVLGSMALALPWEPLNRWHGSPKLLAGVALFLGLSAWAADEVRQAARYAPWAFLALGAGLAVVGMQLAFARERLRERALTLLMLFGSNWRALTRQAQADRKAVGRDWLRAPLGQTLSAWRRALWHERFGGLQRLAGVRLVAILVSAYAGLGAVALAAYIKSKNQPVTFATMAERFHALVWTEGWDGALIPLVPFVASLALVMGFSMTLTFPTPSRLYPVSRHMMLRLALSVCLAEGAKAMIYGTLVLGALAWLTSWMVSTPFEFRQIPLFAIPLTLLPTLPLLAWSGLGWVRTPGNSIRYLSWKSLSAWLGVTAVAMTTTFVLSLFAEKIFAPAGLAGILLATAITGSVFIWRARKLYLERDLLSRSGA